MDCAVVTQSREIAPFKNLFPSHPNCYLPCLHDIVLIDYFCWNDSTIWAEHLDLIWAVKKGGSGILTTPISLVWPFYPLQDIVCCAKVDLEQAVNDPYCCPLTYYLYSLLKLIRDNYLFSKCPSSLCWLHFNAVTKWDDVTEFWQMIIGYTQSPHQEDSAPLNHCLFLSCWLIACSCPVVVIVHSPLSSEHIGNVTYPYSMCMLV